MNSKGEPATNFFPVSHSIVESDQFKSLGLPAKILYFTFCHIRNRYADDKGIFYRSLSQLAKDSGMSLWAVKTAKKDLLKADFIAHKVTTFSNNRQLKATIYKIKN